MESENFLLVLAVVALVFASGALFFSYSSVLTGFAVSTATVNISVESASAINFTTNNINFGSGRVNLGMQNATLITGGSGYVSGGNWTAVANGFVLENIGNINLSINLTTGKTASTFIGGTNPLYRYNVTDVESGSCLNYTGTGAETNLSVFVDAPGSTTKLLCGTFPSDNGHDTIRIDLMLVIPSDSLTGALSDIFTVTTNI